MTSFTKLCFTRGFRGQTALGPPAASDSAFHPPKRKRDRNQRNSFKENSWLFPLFNLEKWQ